MRRARGNVETFRRKRAHLSRQQHSSVEVILQQARSSSAVAFNNEAKAAGCS